MFLGAKWIPGNLIVSFRGKEKKKKREKKKEREMYINKIINVSKLWR